MGSTMKDTQMQCETISKEVEGASESNPSVISESAICKFVEKIDNLWKIESKHLWGDRFRINVWTETQKDGMFCSFHRIEKSYFVKLVDGEIVDLTVKPKSKGEKLF